MGEEERTELKIDMAVAIKAIESLTEKVVCMDNKMSKYHERLDEIKDKMPKEFPCLNNDMSKNPLGILENYRRTLNELDNKIKENKKEAEDNLLAAKDEVEKGIDLNRRLIFGSYTFSGTTIGGLWLWLLSKLHGN